MVQYLSQIFLFPGKPWRWLPVPALSQGSASYRGNFHLFQIFPLPILNLFIKNQWNGMITLSRNEPLSCSWSVTFTALRFSVQYVQAPIATGIIIPRLIILHHHPDHNQHRKSSPQHPGHTQHQRSSSQECFQQMPLPFTGLQAFHWGDGVKVLFL